ncbi:MAG: hypothetical protein E6J43_06100 [Chloroflexi bacterium]|nr:MAG: hypothetical protein E6J43_06100 [Chloroflexota bacterium]
MPSVKVLTFASEVRSVSLTTISIEVCGPRTSDTRTAEASRSVNVLTVVAADAPRACNASMMTDSATTPFSTAVARGLRRPDAHFIPMTPARILAPARCASV